MDVPIEMKKEIKEYETKILKIVDHELLNVWKKFKTKDIFITGPSLKVYNEGGNYTSEIEISFIKNEELVDCIESLIICNEDFWFSDEDEFEKWFVEVLEEVYNNY